MTLNAPTKLIFLLSLILAIIAVVAALQLVSFLPIAGVWIMLAAYGLLAIGCMFTGI